MCLTSLKGSLHCVYTYACVYVCMIYVIFQNPYSGVFVYMLLCIVFAKLLQRGICTDVYTAINSIRYKSYQPHTLFSLCLYNY